MVIFMFFEDFFPGKIIPGKWPKFFPGKIMPAQAGIIEFTFYISASRESDILIIARSGIFFGEVMKTNESNKRRSAAWISGALKRQSIPKGDFV